VVDYLPLWIVVGQGPPSAAFREDVQDGAEYVVRVKPPGLRFFARRFQQGTYQSKLFPRYVAGVWGSRCIFHGGGVILHDLGGI